MAKGGTKEVTASDSKTIKSGYSKVPDSINEEDSDSDSSRKSQSIREQESQVASPGTRRLRPKKSRSATNLNFDP